MLKTNITSYEYTTKSVNWCDQYKWQYNWRDHENFLPALFFTPLLLLYTFLQLPHSIPFCQTFCISSSRNNLHFLTFRSNHFLQNIDSCWYGSDCVPNVITVSSTFLRFNHLNSETCTVLVKCSSVPITKSDSCCFFSMFQPQTCYTCWFPLKVLSDNSCK